jgi:F0F1-type ATP synthase epsilon subunit
MAKRQDASTGQIVDDGVAEPLASEKLVDGKPVMLVMIYSPFKVYMNEDAFSISAENATGPFDILPKHHNFMSLLNACEVHVVAPSGDKRIRISGGLMQVKADTVKVFLDV